MNKLGQKFSGSDDLVREASQKAQIVFSLVFIFYILLLVFSIFTLCRSLGKVKLLLFLLSEGRRVVMRGQAFGVGAFEEDDEDIYARDDMTQYDFEEVDHRTPIKGELSRRNESAMIGKEQLKTTV